MFLFRTYSKFIRESSLKMSIFIQKLNPMTGVNDWVVQQEDYDYHQEVARASYADMLHDTERNQKYESAIKWAIELMHSRGKKANVLDIGTGTGLLSMMAVRHGADTVTACEAFKPMSEVAAEVIRRNGCESKIKIIPKRSTDIIIGENGDLQQPCNILVTEVFDTELIGEGALSTFSHANKFLLEEDSIVVPQSATIYAQVVECPVVQNWNKAKDIYDSDGKLLVEVPTSIKKCAGSVSVHDLQLSQLKSELFKTIISPIPVLHFCWSGKIPFKFERSNIHTVKAEQTATAQAAFMWWDLQMDDKTVLSCAPYWAHPFSKTGEKLPWRDHWMQAIYYLPEEIQVQQNQELNLISSHDEFSLWFKLKTDSKLSDSDYVKPICRCGLHAAFSRTRIGQINDNIRNKKYLTLLEQNIKNDSTVLVLSDGFYLSLSAAKMGAKKVYYVETNHLSRKILLDYIAFNQVDNVEVFENLKTLQAREDIKDINLVFSEPYFMTSILPWDNLLFTYLLKGARNILSNDVKIFPKSATIKAVAVNFSDLNKIRTPLHKCEGFTMCDFDSLIEDASRLSDDNVEAQPLWEYPGIAVSETVDIISIDSINIPEQTVETKGIFSIKEGFGGCNGIALWVEWLHGDDPKTMISSGPITAPEIGEQLNWYMHTRQGVCLFETKDESCIKYSFTFDFNEGNISFLC